MNDDFEAPDLIDDRGQIGGNNPPSPIELANDTFDALSKFLSDHPVIDDGKAATEAKLFCDRAEATKKDIEDDRARKADPLYSRWKAIREPYDAPLKKLEALIKQLKSRMTAWALEEERKRKAAADEAARIAEAARLAAEAAERAAIEAIDNAAQGEFTDVGKTVSDARAAIDQASRAERAAVIAERDSKVKVMGGFTKAMGLRTVAVYAVDDVQAAIRALWPNNDIREAILKAARAFDAEFKTVPSGITKTEERKL